MVNCAAVVFFCFCFFNEVVNIKARHVQNALNYMSSICCGENVKRKPDVVNCVTGVVNIFRI